MKFANALLFALAMFTAIGCSSSSKKVEVMGDDSTALPPSEELAEEVEKASVVQKVIKEEAESIVEDRPATDAIELILATGIFHGDEVEEGIEKLEWVGIFDEGEKLVVAKTKVIAQRVNDAIIDGEGEKTGWQIKAEKESCVLLVSGVSAIKLGAFPKVLPENETLSLGESFDLGKVKVNIVGNMREEGIVGYYSWVAVGERDGKMVKQLLSGEEDFDDAMYKFVAVADLDGDGIPDIIADLTNHYNVSKKVLFLSSLAEEGEWYKKVGEFYTVGC